MGMSARPDEIYECLFEFDTKEKIIEEEKVKGKIDIPLFKPEN